MRTGQLGQQLAIYLPEAIRRMRAMLGPDHDLTCPAPPSDPDGEYRIGLDGHGIPEVQRRDPLTGTWGPAPEVLDVVDQRRQRLQHARDLLGQALVHSNVPDDARALVQQAHDSLEAVLRS